MRLALIESPFMFRHPDADTRAVGLLRNITYARMAMRDAITHGYAPYASHLLLTQPLILDDDLPEERTLGIDVGLAWGAMAEVTLAYMDLGVSTGMRYGFEHAIKAGRALREMRLKGWENALEESPSDTLLRLGVFDADSLREALRSGPFGHLPLRTTETLGLGLAATP